VKLGRHWQPMALLRSGAFARLSAGHETLKERHLRDRGAWHVKWIHAWAAKPETEQVRGAASKLRSWAPAQMGPPPPIMDLAQQIAKPTSLAPAWAQHPGRI